MDGLMAGSMAVPWVAHSAVPKAAQKDDYWVGLLVDQTAVWMADRWAGMSVAHLAAY